MDQNNTIPGQFDDADESIPESNIFWTEAMNSTEEIVANKRINTDNNQPSVTRTTMNTAYNSANKQKKMHLRCHTDQTNVPQSTRQDLSNDYTTMVKDHLKLIKNCIPKSMMSSY